MRVADFVSILDALPLGAMLVDRDGRILHANTLACELVQRPREGLLGAALHELDAGASGGSAIAQVLASPAPRDVELLLPRGDGTRLPVLLASRSTGFAAEWHDGAASGDVRLVTLIDVSRQKRAEAALQERFRDVAALSDTVLEQALALKRHAEALEQRVRERTLDLKQANMEAIYMLAVASEAKDHDTGAHVRRIEQYTRLLTRELGLAEDEGERIAYSSILHDVGKIHVPDAILNKAGPLSESEWEIMRQHTIVGERILSRQPFFEVARRIARSHHENWDGSGYPDGLREQQIPLPARIVRVADVYDALTTPRSYKPAWSGDQALRVIEHGRMFDPQVVCALVSMYRAGRFTTLIGRRDSAIHVRPV